MQHGWPSLHHPYTRICAECNLHTCELVFSFIFKIKARACSDWGTWTEILTFLLYFFSLQFIAYPAPCRLFTKKKGVSLLQNPIKLLNFYTVWKHHICDPSSGAGRKYCFSFLVTAFKHGWKVVLFVYGFYYFIIIIRAGSLARCFMYISYATRTRPDQARPGQGREKFCHGFSGSSRHAPMYATHLWLMLY